ncbi:hypothetical protein [Meiothermus granaticius]|uniref:Uncharacterized protein n=1 Tax=Meiothermus granaticius NBRC 107808 TaxID=1227551 RepID=A0A399FBI9_9DEIN|nr:hypothetical protein [Meiothermus granaticius]RIH93974.1 hypothetical protein Mgrana_00060 [Meiothermus granaticius NBRC 107808]GEM88198.1 hypothetical protein MGR01S_28230 [Meiothermus granaticius NBRC 107808]
MRQRLSKRRWTPEELVYLRRNYTLLGPARCAERLGRTTPAVLYQASVLGLSTHEAPQGWLSLGEASQIAGIDRRTLWAAARQIAKATKQSTRGHRVCCVREEVVERLIARHSEYLRAKAQGWLTPSRAARALGVSPKALHHSLRLNSGPLAQAIEGLERAVSLGGHILLNPAGVQMARAKLRGQRGISLKALCVECEINPATARYRLRKAQVLREVRLSPAGRRTIYVLDPEQARKALASR